MLRAKSYMYSSKQATHLYYIIIQLLSYLHYIYHKTLYINL